MSGSSSQAKYFLRNPSAGAPALGLAQSFWALSERDVSRAGALHEACAEGFEYFEVGLRDERLVETRALLREFPLKLIAQGWALDATEAAFYLQRAADFEAICLNLHLGHAYLTTGEAVDLIGAVERQAKSLGMPLLLETHRGRLSQDIYRFAKVVALAPETVVALDVSHYIVAGETFGGSESMFYRHLEPMLARTALIHGRISNGQAIQVPADLDPLLTDVFQGIWQRTMELWLRDAPRDGIFLFEPELGPAPYAYVKAGSEMFNRARHSRMLTHLAEKAWESAQAIVTSSPGPLP